MNLRKIFIPLGIVALAIAGYRAYGLQGILTVSGGWSCGGCCITRVS